MFFKSIAQWLKRLGQWLVVDVHPRLRPEKAEDEFSTLKTYSQRYGETSEMTTEEIRSMIAERESEGKPCGVAYRVLAGRSDALAAAWHEDPPRLGRKTYVQRYRETSAMSTSAIRALIAEREVQGKECGVLYRVLSERTW